ncbi:MAG: alanine--tRNA ligase [Calditrichaeota bacterium]|nr:alanine--tRNA ligase [Calditrichota bacterium]
MTAAEIRQLFLDFFRERQHLIVPSAPVVPQDDPTLLFTNAGMNQFKPYFLGLAKPEATRVADTQKCIRVSGKHNDLEEVGVSPYHHTFFEMLGNWSFGDYFKRDSIRWGWELMTEGFKLPKDKLYATVYETDDEAEELWKGETDIIPSHVLRFGKKDNWWSMGDTGPCGPCTEIHIDRGPEFDSDPKAFVNTDSRRYIELWNHVFIQFDSRADGSLVPLPAKHVDTGAGLERFATVLGGHNSNYDTDLFQPIIRAIVDASGKEYSQSETGIPHRVIADHVRCLTFAIGDGAMPGNEGRGYVLRRILRRAARFGRKLELHEPFIYKLVPVLVDTMGSVFPEIKERHSHIARVIEAEESHFGKTLDRGLEQFDQVIATVRGSNASEIPGEEVFKLYDTFGFPLDLTQLMARENGLSVDEAGFTQAMERQRARARAAGSFKAEREDLVFDGELPETEFVGYTSLTIATDILPVSYDPESGRLVFVVKQTPFYVESGGQVSDSGTLEIELDDATVHARVNGVSRRDKSVLHVATLDHLSAELQKAVAEKQWLRGELSVSREHRLPTQYNHTATHLLHAALRAAFGDHVHQAGSYVGPDYLRFDYTHFNKPSLEELGSIETQVNEWIRGNYSVNPNIMPLTRAQELGAMALFGEKYGDEVRMIEISDEESIVSRELCGGCHVNRTGDIGVFVIKAETSAAAGIRRVEALTGETAWRYLADQRAKVEQFVDLLGSAGSDPAEKLRLTLDEKKALQKELDQLRGQLAGSAMQSLAQNAQMIGSIRLVAQRVDAHNLDQLKEMGDALRDQLSSGIGVLGMVAEDKPALAVVVTPDLVKAGWDAVPIVKELAKSLKGGGGGKPHLATAGGKDASMLDHSLSLAPALIQKLSEATGS